MKKQVINFRVTPEEKKLIEADAKAQNLNVSDWLRSAANDKLKATKVDVAGRKKPEAQDSKEKPICVMGDPVNCPAERVRLPTGVKVCVKCGLK